MKSTAILVLTLLSLSTSFENEDRSCVNPDCEDEPDSSMANGHYMTNIEDESESNTISPDIPEISDECKDEHDDCELWASEGECDNNPFYMRKSCKISCGSCISLKLGEEQMFEGLSSLSVYRRSIEYLEQEVMVKPEYAKIRQHCANTHAKCSYWASIGECEANKIFMRKGCALACRSCIDLNVMARCPIDSSTDAVHSGDLANMFERISDTSEGSEYAKYKPNILSRPVTAKKEPWVVVFDSFLSDEECDKLIEWGEKLEFERSGNVGKANPDGSYESNIDESRTSVNTWCRSECDEDPIVKQVVERIGNVTGIPTPNQEYLQLLKYDSSQYYKMHHDFIPFHVERQSGPRILTLLLYLNEMEGGGTQFSSCIDDCDILTQVSPKKGKALLWHNVLLDDPNKIEMQTHHEAMPVVNGVKYAANAWIHLRDFKAPHETGCV